MRKKVAIISKILINGLDNYNYIKEICNGKNVLDIGCGFGLGGYFLFQNKTKSYIGIDINKDAIKYAKSHFESDKVKYFCSDAEKIKIKNEFDIIVSFDVIEHLNNHFKYLENIKKLLKKRGLFILTTPNKYSTLEQLNRIPIYHKHEFYENEIKDLLLKYFKSIEFKYIKKKSNKSDIIKWELFSLLRFAPSKLMEFYLDRNALSAFPPIKKIEFTIKVKDSDAFLVTARK
jgi:SAM-dependent methyltransferase